MDPLSRSRSSRRRRHGVSWRRFGLRAAGVIVLLAAGSAALGWRARTASARVPALPSLAGLPPTLVDHIEEADRQARRWPQRVEAVGALAMTYHADLFYEPANIGYSLAAELDGADWRWPYYQALVHMERGQLIPAAVALNVVVGLRPDLALAWWRLGETEFKRANYNEADAAYARAESAPAASEGAGVATYARAGRARVAFYRGDRKAAAEILTSLLQASPRFGPAHRILADVYRAEGRQADADRHGVLGAALRAYAAPTDPAVDVLADLSRNSVFLLRLAASLDLNRQAARRTELVKRALESDDTNPDVVYEMGSLFQQLRRPAEALPYFTRHVEMVTDDQQTLVQIAKCHIDLDRLDEAEAMLRKALALGDDAVGFHNLGVVLERRDRTVEAEGSYRRAVALGPALAGARNNLGVLVASNGRLDEAARLLLESIRLDPIEPNAYANLSVVRLQQRAVPEAIRYARLAIELDPRHADAHANLGVALAQSGDLDTARKEFEVALSIDPRHVNARRNLDAIQQAR